MTQKYINLSKQFNLDPCQMSLSFCIGKPFMTSVIFGATSKEQLLNNLKSINKSYHNKEVLRDITFSIAENSIFGIK